MNYADSLQRDLLGNLPIESKSDFSDGLLFLDEGRDFKNKNQIDKAKRFFADGYNKFSIVLDNTPEYLRSRVMFFIAQANFEISETEFLSENYDLASNTLNSALECLESANKSLNNIPIHYFARIHRLSASCLFYIGQFEECIAKCDYTITLIGENTSDIHNLIEISKVLKLKAFSYLKMANFQAGIGLIEKNIKTVQKIIEFTEDYSDTKLFDAYYDWSKVLIDADLEDKKIISNLLHLAENECDRLCSNNLINKHSCVLLYNKIGILLFEVQDGTGEIRLYTKAINLLNRFKNIGNYADTAAIYNNRAESYFTQKEYKLSKQDCLKSILFSKRAMSVKVENSANNYFWTYLSYYRVSYEEDIANHSKSLIAKKIGRTARKAVKNKHDISDFDRYIMSLYILQADCYEDAKKYNKALKSYEKALKLIQHDHDSLFVSKIFNRRASLHSQFGYNNQAAMDYISIAKLFQEDEDKLKSDDSDKSIVSRMYLNAAISFELGGNFITSNKYLTKTIGLIESTENFSQDTDSMETLALTYFRRAINWSFLSNQNFSKSYSDYLKCENILTKTEELFDAEKINLVRSARSEIFEAFGELESAEKLYYDCKQLYQAEN